MTATTVTELIGVYDADGSWRAELASVLGRLAGRTHCALSDITHGSLRRRAEFDVARSSFAVPFMLLHRDERPPDVLAVTGDDTPMVLGRTADGLAIVLGAEQLEACGSSPEALTFAIEDSVAALGLRFATSATSA